MTALPEEVVFANASRVRAGLLAGRAPDGGIREIDCSTCRRFDSSLLSVMLEIARHARSGERAPRFVNVDPKLRQLAVLYGVDGLLFPGKAA